MRCAEQIMDSGKVGEDRDVVIKMSMKIVMKVMVMKIVMKVMMKAVMNVAMWE